MEQTKHSHIPAVRPLGFYLYGPDDFGAAQRTAAAHAKYVRRLAKRIDMTIALTDRSARASELRRLMEMLKNCAWALEAMYGLQPSDER